MTMDAWTDSRLDDLAESVRPLPGELARVSAEVAGLSAKVDGIARDMELMRADQSASRADLSAFQRQIAQIGWSITGVMVASIFALLIALV